MWGLEAADGMLKPGETEIANQPWLRRAVSNLAFAGSSRADIITITGIHGLRQLVCPWLRLQRGTPRFHRALAQIWNI
jgi:hypothetical protein